MASIHVLPRPIARHLLALAAAGLVSAALGGERTASAEEMIRTTAAPPTPIVEVVSAAPSHHHFWTPGYWNYHPRYGHRWVPGYWQAYRPGCVWTQPAWRRVGRTWVLQRGGWIARR